MLRSDRGIILAAFGWLALTAASPEQKANDHNQADAASAKALQNIASAIQQANERSEPDAGCQPGQDARNSDLCAQWKAADAAKDSTDWARRAFWLALLGTFIGAFTLGAAGFAAWYARAAAKHTKTGANEARRAADAAERQIAVAEQSAEYQLRPYLGVSAENTTFGDMRGFSLEIKNVGIMPAKQIIVKTAMSRSKSNRPDRNKDGIPTPQGEQFFKELVSGDNIIIVYHTDRGNPIFPLISKGWFINFQIDVRYEWVGLDGRPRTDHCVWDAVTEGQTFEDVTWQPSGRTMRTAEIIQAKKRSQPRRKPKDETNQPSPPTGDSPG